MTSAEIHQKTDKGDADKHNQQHQGIVTLHEANNA